MTRQKLPALSGTKLITLLKSDGWVEHGHRTHGLALIKRIGKRTKVTIIPNTSASLPIGTLMAILGPKQTRIGKEGLSKLIYKYRKEKSRTIK